jgi:multimeric flavodoxin WrbA
VGDTQTVRDALAECDGVVIGTPVYYLEPCGDVMAFLSRLFFSCGDLLRFKPASAVAVCRRGGATNAASAIESFFKFRSMPIIYGSYPAIFYDSGRDEGKMDEEGLQNMRSAARALFYIAEALKIAKDSGVTPPREEQKIKTDIGSLLKR